MNIHDITPRELSLKVHYENHKTFQLDDNDIEFPLINNPELRKWMENKFIELSALPKDKLEIGKYYYGASRNTDEAMWNGNTFEYEVHKFGFTYKDNINHFQDDDGYDVFVPIKLVEEE